MSSVKTSQDVKREQISELQNTIKEIIKNARFGSNENLMKNLAKIDILSSKLQTEMTGIHSVVRKYDKILVPYDGSSFSKNALGEALEMSRMFNSKIYILSVIEIASDIPPGLLTDVINKKLGKLKREIKLPKKFSTPTKLQRLIDECIKHGVDVQVEILVGHISDSILKFANQNKIDLIVIGSRGLHGIKKLAALGSVSRRISEEAKCPVMIIR